MQNSHKPIPVNDLSRNHHMVDDDLKKMIADVVASGRYSQGPWLEEFETAFAEYIGVSDVVGVANGTDALELALRSLDISAGDEVVTVANAGGYSSVAIIHADATPIYADVDASTFLMTPNSLSEAITPNTKAVIVTHLYGLMANMSDICRVAQNHGIAVIEDCAQAHGAEHQGKKAGGWGNVGCFSFYPTKNLGALGDAGCVTTNDKGLAKNIKQLRHYGWQSKYNFSTQIGRNSRMDEIQAAVLVYFLGFLDARNKVRKEIATYYHHHLSSYDIKFQAIDDAGAYVAHLLVGAVTNRDFIQAALTQKSVGTDIHYPILDYQQLAFSPFLNREYSLPATQRLALEVLTLPCFPGMELSEAQYVVEVLQEHLPLCGSI